VVQKSHQAANLQRVDTNALAPAVVMVLLEVEAIAFVFWAVLLVRTLEGQLAEVLAEHYTLVNWLSCDHRPISRAPDPHEAQILHLDTVVLDQAVPTFAHESAALSSTEDVESAVSAGVDTARFSAKALVKKTLGGPRDTVGVEVGSDARDVSWPSGWGKVFRG
jgi:hypothetical protein